MPSLIYNLADQYVFQDSVLSKVRPKKFVLEVSLIGLTLCLICISTTNLDFVVKCI